MVVRVGLVGLPNAGKSTLFNAVTRAGAATASFPFTTIEPNVGVVPVPDSRVERVAELAGSARAVPVTIEVVDIAGLVEGASRGEGLGNRFLAAIREVDAVCHVVRCFEDPDVAHVAGTVDPVRDIDVVETELLLKDLETVERRRDRVVRQARSDASVREEAELVEQLHGHLASGGAARTFPGARQVEGLLAELSLLTAKPVLFAANVAEDDLPDGGARAQAVAELARPRSAETVVVCAELESQLLELPAVEQAEYLQGLGLEASGLERLVRASYRLLNLVTFFTANENEAHAWTIPTGTTVDVAAGRVHTDMQRGFVKAEVMSFAAFDELGSVAAVREAGRLRIEGRGYEVEDGDVIEVRFAQ
jgi:ribosome-binding ATPase